MEWEAVVAFFAITASDGKTYKVEHFNLDAIISVGYRVNSIRETQFRIWATQHLREYLIKGFTMDDEWLKQTGFLTEDSSGEKPLHNCGAFSLNYLMLAIER